MTETLTDLFGLPPDAEWQARAACANASPELFTGRDATLARPICNRCPVQRDCLDYALENDERFGVWGGLSVRERDRLRQRR